MAYVNVAEWTPRHVGEWLRGLDDTIQPYIQFFLNNNINGCHLLTLAHNDLNSLNIHKLGHQDLILEGVELLQHLHYNLSSETLQSAALKLGCKCQGLFNALKRVVRREEEDNVKERISNETLFTTSEILTSSKTLISWLDRYPFAGQDRYDEVRGNVLQTSIELASTAQRDQFAEKPHSVIFNCCSRLSEACDKVVRKFNDLLVSQQVSLDVASFKKRTEEDLGLHIHSSYFGMHIIGGIKFQSPAHRCGKIDDGDEIIQVNFQTVTGWQLKNLVCATKENSNEIHLTLKKRPKYTPPVEDPKIVWPHRLPSKRTAFRRMRSSKESLGQVAPILEGIRDENEMYEEDSVFLPTPTTTITNRSRVVRRATIGGPQDQMLEQVLAESLTNKEKMCRTNSATSQGPADSSIYARLGSNPASPTTQEQTYYNVPLNGMYIPSQSALINSSTSSLGIPYNGTSRPYPQSQPINMLPSSQSSSSLLQSPTISTSINPPLLTSSYTSSSSTSQESSDPYSKEMNSPLLSEESGIYTLKTSSPSMSSKESETDEMKELVSENVKPPTPKPRTLKSPNIRDHQKVSSPPPSSSEEAEPMQQGQLIPANSGDLASTKVAYVRSLSCGNLLTEADSSDPYNLDLKKNSGDSSDDEDSPEKKRAEDPQRIGYPPNHITHHAQPLQYSAASLDRKKLHKTSGLNAITGKVSQLSQVFNKMSLAPVPKPRENKHFVQGRPATATIHNHHTRNPRQNRYKTEVINTSCLSLPQQRPPPPLPHSNRNGTQEHDKSQYNGSVRENHQHKPPQLPISMKSATTEEIQQLYTTRSELTNGRFCSTTSNSSRSHPQMNYSSSSPYILPHNSHSSFRPPPIDHHIYSRVCDDEPPVSRRVDRDLPKQPSIIPTNSFFDICNSSSPLYGPSINGNNLKLSIVPSREDVVNHNNKTNHLSSYSHPRFVHNGHHTNASITKETTKLPTRRSAGKRLPPKREDSFNYSSDSSSISSSTSGSLDSSASSCYYYVETRVKPNHTYIKDSEMPSPPMMGVSMLAKRKPDCNSPKHNTMPDFVDDLEGFCV